VYLPVADHSEQYAKEGIKVDVIKNKDGKHKGVGVEGTALTSEQKAQMQEEVEEIYKEFKGAVLNKRSVKEQAMQGQAFMAKSAVDMGLVDAVGDFESAFLLLDIAVKKAQGLTGNLK
jgi:protease-4